MQQLGEFFKKKISWSQKIQNYLIQQEIAKKNVFEYFLKNYKLKFKPKSRIRCTLLGLLKIIKLILI